MTFCIPKTPRYVALALLCLTAASHATEDLGSGFDCVIMPSQTVELGSAVPGQLSEVLVDRSDSVRAGQVVARLDSRLEEANLAIADFKADTDTQVRLRNAALAIDQRAEERLKSEFEGVTRTYVPLQSVIRIDEVAREGTNKIIAADGQPGTVTPFPQMQPPNRNRTD